MEKSTVTVQQMIDSLKRFNPDDPLEIAIRQYNKRYAVAHVPPSEVSYANVGGEKHYAQKIDGRHVRIEIQLPTDYENKTFMYTATKKMR